MENLVRDIKQGVRSLARDKTFSFMVGLTLALTIAANTTIFAIVHSVLLHPLPLPDADRIVLMTNLYPKAGAADEGRSSAGDYYDRIREVPALTDEAMFDDADQDIEVNGRAERIPGMAVTPSFFKLIRINPSLGRAFTAEEGEYGANQKIILSDALWHRVYGGDPGVIGRSLRVGGVPYTIVGIMPRGFNFIRPEVRFWTPLAFTAEQKKTHHNNNWRNIARLAPGATIAQAQAQVDALNAENLERFPEFKELLINAGFHTQVQPLLHTLVKDVEGVLYLLWGGALFVLLIGALNITNLVLARVTVRAKEIATRVALGASRTRLASQFIVEHVTIAFAGGIAGLLLSQILIRMMATFGMDKFPRADEVRVDGTVALVAMALAIGVGVVMGLVPLASAFKSNLSGTLRDASRTGTVGARTRRVRQALVAVEVGFAFVLLAGAGLLLTSFRNLLAVDPGFTSSGVLTASTSAPSARYHSDAEVRSVVKRTLGAIRQLPGVTAAGVTSSIPFGGDYSDSVIFAEGHPMKPGESLVSPHQLDVSPGYFEAMKIRLVRGRYFDDRDDENAQRVIVVDERLARFFWPNQDPIGRRVYRPESANDLLGTSKNTHWWRVVGVVRSVRLTDLAGTKMGYGEYYFPYAQDVSRNFTFAIRTTGDTASATHDVQAAIARVDPELALFDVRTMVERTQLSVSSKRTAMILALSFGGLALFLSGVGIYGVLAYLVTQRRREIGIRVALGSSGAGIVALILREGIALVAIGLVAGFAGAAALRTAIANQIYGVHPMDARVLAGVVVLLAIVAVAACVLPARRALRVDPVVVLTES